MEYAVVFDLSPGATGAYYVIGEVVWHQSRVCQVVGTVRLGGQRFRATLRPLPRPTPDQRKEAERWRRRFPAAGGR
ncbi:MAG: hypothetical protein WB441_14395 [Nocardioidaceae bacterium]